MKLRSSFIIYVAGLVTALLGVAVFQAVSYVSTTPSASVAAVTLPMAPVGLPNAVIRSGHPNFHAAVYTTSPANDTHAGVWSAEGPSTMDISYAIDEAIYVQEGQVDIDYQGQKFTLKPGDSAFFQAGTTATWHVPSYVRKSWTIYRPSRTVDWYRKLTSFKDGL